MAARSTSYSFIHLGAIFSAYCLVTKHALAFSTGGSARTRAVINKAPTANRQEWQPGVEIELPDMELLFDRIATASPLAKAVMAGNSGGGFEDVDDSVQHHDLKWKKVEGNRRRTVHRIDKAESFQGIRKPLLRFRSSIKGPCIGERFSHFIMDLEERKKWDDQIAKLEEMYPVDDLDSVNTIFGDQGKYGDVTRLGVGYTQTKSGIISPREQLTLAGCHQYEDGATILWGTEMEEQHDYLLPEGQRHTRAKSHLFAATLAPTGSDSFDVEYLLQMDVGGGLPHFITTPALTDAVKKMFEHARKFFAGGDGSELDLYLKSRTQAERSDINQDAEIETSGVHLNDNESILFTP
ncbi:hypothetical protein ACHAWF_016098 [Thalassiosira exigua]